MSTTTRLTTLCVVVALAVSCRDERSATSPHRLSAELLDGSSLAGNPHFFFLPPLVSQPTFSGTFNTNLAPVVDICQLTVDSQGNPIACTTDPSISEINPGAVAVDQSTQHYGVNWHTDQPQVDVTKFYRIRVRGGTGLPVLGFVDVQPVVNGGGLKDVNTGQYIGLVDGRTLPIKFRVEQGALCFGQTDCVEGTVGPGGGDVVAPSVLAAVHFPTGYFSQNTTVTIAQVLTGCFSASTPPPSGFDAFACYAFSTSPKVGDPLGCTEQPGGTFPPTTSDMATCARVEVCPSLDPGDTHIHDLRLLKSDPGVPATTLEEAPATLIHNCEVTFNSGMRGRRAVDLAIAKWRGVMSALGRLALPTPVFGATAVSHLGVGGLTCCLSNIGFGPLALTGVSFPEGGPTLTIGSAEVFVTSMIVNSTVETTIRGVSLQAFIVQSTTSASAGSTSQLCDAASGDVVPGTCTSTNSSFMVPGIFVPTTSTNPATARFELHQGATLLDVVNVPVTLVASPP